MNSPTVSAPHLPVSREPSAPSDRGASPTDLEWLTERLAASPALRTQLAETIVDDLRAAHRTPQWRRLSTLVASASSVAVVLFAFLIPSAQDQWDRYQSRRVVQDYAEMGRAFMRASHYRQAEQAFGKAIELSEGRRLDLEPERLDARVQQMSLEPTWGVNNPEGLEEGDFLYLMQFQQRARDSSALARTLTSYADFLGTQGRADEAEAMARSAIATDPQSADAQVSLGNVLSDLDRAGEAEAAYLRALHIDPNSASAHYDLGLLYSESGRVAEAEAAFQQTALLAPSDRGVLAELAAQLTRNGKTAAAALVQERLTRLPPPHARRAPGDSRPR